MGAGGRPVIETPWWRAFLLTDEQRLVFRFIDCEWRHRGFTMFVPLMAVPIWHKLLRLDQFSLSNSPPTLLSQALAGAICAMTACLLLVGRQEAVRKDHRLVAWLADMVYIFLNVMGAVHACLAFNANHVAAVALNAVVSMHISYLGILVFKISGAGVTTALLANVITSVYFINVEQNRIVCAQHLGIKVVTLLVCCVMRQVETAYFIDWYQHGHDHRKPLRPCNLFLLHADWRDHWTFVRYVQRRQFVGLCIETTIKVVVVASLTCKRGLFQSGLFMFDAFAAAFFAAALLIGHRVIMWDHKISFGLAIATALTSSTINVLQEMRPQDLSDEETHVHILAARSMMQLYGAVCLSCLPFWTTVIVTAFSVIIQLQYSWNPVMDACILQKFVCVYIIYVYSSCFRSQYQERGAPPSSLQIQKMLQRTIQTPFPVWYLSLSLVVGWIGLCSAWAFV